MSIPGGTSGHTAESIEDMQKELQAKKNEEVWFKTLHFLLKYMYVFPVDALQRLHDSHLKLIPFKNCQTTPVWVQHFWPCHYFVTLLSLLWPNILHNVILL